MIYPREDKAIIVRSATGESVELYVAQTPFGDIYALEKYTLEELSEDIGGLENAARECGFLCRQMSKIPRWIQQWFDVRKWEAKDE